MPGTHPSHARRMVHLALGTVGVLVAAGLVVSVVDEPVLRTRHSSEVLTAAGGSGPAGDDATTDAAADRPRTPDGRVEVRDDWAPLPLPGGWSQVSGLLGDAVDEAEEQGYDLTFCVQALDTADERRVCAGSDEVRYAASVTKIAYAVAALEAWGGDPDAETPTGHTVGELVDAAITVSDNDSADLLAVLAADGPDALDEDPFEAINAVTARVGLEEDFHSGNYYTLGYWSSDWSHLTASGAVRYLAELVRAADGRADAGRAETGTGEGSPDGSGALTDVRVARYVLDAMYRQERTTKLPGDLPAGTTANKTGDLDTVTHDVAVVNTTGGRFAMSAVSTASGLGWGPEALMAETAAEVVDALGGPLRF